MSRILGLLLISLLTFSNSHADKLLEKNLITLSKLKGVNSFYDNKEKIYLIEDIKDKKNTILIIWNHGSEGERDLDKCNKGWAKIPPVVLQLHNKNIKEKQVKLFHLCSGVKGWTNSEQDKMWNKYEKTKKLSLEITDKNGNKIINKLKQIKKQKVINNKIDEFVNQGFDNIVLIGHSAGAWASITLKSKFPKKIDGVIAFQPAFSGTFSDRKKWPWWEDIRKYGISIMKLNNLENILVTAHKKDKYENPKSLSFLSEVKEVNFLDLSNSGCKGKITLGGYHGVTLDKCFADYDKENNYIINYLEQIY